MWVEGTSPKSSGCRLEDGWSVDGIFPLEEEESVFSALHQEDDAKVWELLKISKKVLLEDIHHEGSVSLYQATVKSITAGGVVTLTSSVCNGMLHSASSVDCQDSKILKIEAAEKAKIARCQVTDSIDCGGGVEIDAHKSDLQSLKGDSVTVINAMRIQELKCATALFKGATLGSGDVSEKGTFVDAHVLESVGGTAPHLELVRSTAKRLIFKKPYFIPGSESSIVIRPTPVLKDAIRRFDECILYKAPSLTAKDKGSKVKYLAVLVNSSVEEILFDDPEGWAIEVFGECSLSKIGILTGGEYVFHSVQSER